MTMIIAGYFIYQNFSSSLLTQNMVSPQQKPDETSAFQNQALDSDIIIDEKDKNCTFNTDCAVISIDCGDCGLDVVNKVNTKKYESKLNQVCENKYPEIACDVDYRDTHEIKCVDLRCKFVTKQ